MDISEKMRFAKDEKSIVSIVLYHDGSVSVKDFLEDHKEGILVTVDLNDVDPENAGEDVFTSVLEQLHLDKDKSFRFLVSHLEEESHTILFENFDKADERVRDSVYSRFFLSLPESSLGIVFVEVSDSDNLHVIDDTSSALDRRAYKINLEDYL